MPVLPERSPCKNLIGSFFQEAFQSGQVNAAGAHIAVCFGQDALARPMHDQIEAFDTVQVVFSPSHAYSVWATASQFATKDALLGDLGIGRADP